ncbi:LOW QUALITY PROTEIN: tumor necrosis factor receptor superfamily member 10D [Trachypithecus francoisi]|uniref:LOW QUALITY PROTEIN: tumor necrosis factor receptor superfamily member 10D n=1 Tax=Trachypithecus francoisi TaxID=54180 RepID=UPI00141BE2C9|nr:LOW QUALITY PROTEIN: tumor necrosis factor receptor superfamily member 10D [Trachypithecus francoisi]
MGLCGQSARTASSARAGRYPGARTASGKFVVVIVAVLLLVQVDSATISQQDDAPLPPVDSQQQRRNLEKECPAGYHRSEYSGACKPCRAGVDYTNASNSEPSCLPCAVCKSDEEEMSPCTTTSNTVCQCKPGSFRNGNSTEMCQKCSTGCPRGFIEVSDCTPWSDIICSASAASSTGKTPAAEDTVPTSLGTPALCCLIAGVVTVFIILFAAVFVYLLCWKKLISSLKGICSGGGGDLECVHRVFFWCSCPSRVHVPHGTEDSAHNETLSTRFLQPQVSEREIEGQEPAEPTGVTVQSPEEPQRLLEQAEAEACQRRRLPVPVNDADPTEINTLLDASATLEEGHAKETIQDHMVDSEKLFYEEDDAGFATSSL